MMNKISSCIWILVTLALLVATASAAGSPTAVTSGSVELSPSVLLIGKYDWEILRDNKTGERWSRCLDMVWRAVEAGSSRINFVPTHHWLPDESALNGISSFCYMDTVGPATEDTTNNEYSCSPWTKQIIQEFSEAMTLCLAEAMRQGLTVYVRPHLDDGTAQGAWRNGLLLQPTQTYGGFSYYDIMLQPLADAVRQAIVITTAEESIKPPPGSNRPVVYFALQGEMSATIMRYATDWGRLVAPLRQRIAGNTGSNPADIKIGVGLNFNRLDDTTSISKRYGSSRLSWLMWQMGAEAPAGTREGVPPIDVDGLRQLLTQQLDFVGISAYAPYNLEAGGVPFSEFENSAFMFGREMSEAYDIDILGLLDSGKLELQYSEFGLGGGGSYGGNQVARTPSEVALRPFFGVYGVYRRDRDPWSIPANAAFRQQFYYKALQWLADSNNKTYKLSSVFIWSMASWDVLGVYPESTSSEGSYKDEQVADAVSAYNRAVQQAAGAHAPSTGVSTFQGQAG